MTKSIVVREVFYIDIIKSEIETSAERKKAGKFNRDSGNNPGANLALKWYIVDNQVKRYYVTNAKDPNAVKQEILRPVQFIACLIPTHISIDKNETDFLLRGALSPEEISWEIMPKEKLDEIAKFAQDTSRNDFAALEITHVVLVNQRKSSNSVALEFTVQIRVIQ